MAFNAGMKRDYLARDILLSLLGNPIVDRFLDGHVDNRVPFLVLKSVDLADKLIQCLGETNSATVSGPDRVDTCIGASSTIILDADLDGIDPNFGKWDV